MPSRVSIRKRAYGSRSGSFGLRAGGARASGLRAARSRGVTPAQVRSIAKKAAMRMGETKYFDSTTTTDISTTSEVKGSFMSVPQGDTNVTRDGNSVRGMYVKMNIAVTNGDASNLVRFLVIESDRTSSWSGDLPDVHAYPSPALMEESIKILDDFTVNLTAPYSGGTAQAVIDKHYNLKARKIDYADTATVAPVRGLYLAMVSDSLAVVHPQVIVNYRFAYKDL